MSVDRLAYLQWLSTVNRHVYWLSGRHRITVSQLGSPSEMEAAFRAGRDPERLAREGLLALGVQPQPENDAPPPREPAVDTVRLQTQLDLVLTLLTALMAALGRLEEVTFTLRFVADNPQWGRESTSVRHVLRILDALGPFERADEAAWQQALSTYESTMRNTDKRLPPAVRRERALASARAALAAAAAPTPTSAA